MFLKKGVGSTRKVKLHVYHLFESLLAPALLFPRFVFANSIIGLEFAKEVSLLCYQPLMLDI
jgi:hypothetical protein